MNPIGDSDDKVVVDNPELDANSAVRGGRREVARPVRAMGSQAQPALNRPSTPRAPARTLPAACYPVVPSAEPAKPAAPAAPKPMRAAALKPPADDPPTFGTGTARTQVPHAEPVARPSEAARPHGSAVLSSGTGEWQRPEPTVPGSPTRDLERDPIAVLRTWPVSSKTLPEARVPTRPTLRAATAGPQIGDKIMLAHLALDLYRELEDHDAEAGHAPVLHDDACDHPRCQARASALRGALIEACLLVQRAALNACTRDEIDDRLRALLSLLDS